MMAIKTFLLLNCNNVSEFTPSSGYKSVHRAVARALIGGVENSYIRVMPDGFLLKSVVFRSSYGLKLNGFLI